MPTIYLNLMMKQCLKALVLLVWAGSIQALELNRAQQPIQQTSEKLYQILQSDRQALQNDRQLVLTLVEEVVEPHVDFNLVSALVLGKHWRSANIEQREAFKGAFKALLVNTYATAFTEFTEWSIHFLPMQLESGVNKVIVRTQVIQPGIAPVAVDYRMRLNKSAHWQIYDVMIEGISMVTNYRTGFARQIKESGGLDALITKLNSKHSLHVAESVNE